MTFDFLDLYQDYSTFELLKIVRRPDDHQPQAVEAATKILMERVITMQDEDAVDRYYLELDKKEKEQKQKIQGYQERVTDLIEPIVHPKETVEPGKFVNILLLLIALQYGWWFYHEARRFIANFRHGLPPFNFLFYFQFLIVPYIPIVFFLIYRRKKWGWILLFADSLFTLIFRLAQILYVIEGYFNSVWYLYVIFIRLLFLIVLWRPMIAEHFTVTPYTKKKTLLIVSVIALLFISCVYFVYR